jgi:hypothetical protein
MIIGRLKLLEDDNAKLRNLIAALSRDREMLQDVTRRPAPSSKRAVGDDAFAPAHGHRH